MATIYPRGRFWRALVRRGGESLSATFDTEDEARDWSREQEEAIATGRPVSAPYTVRAGYQPISEASRQKRAVFADVASPLPLPPAPKRGSHLYVMQNGLGFIKIGRSVDVENRRKEIEFAGGVIVHLIGKIEDGGYLERPLLLRFKRYQIVGEWFRNERSLRDELQSTLKVTLTFPVDAPDRVEEGVS